MFIPTKKDTTHCILEKNDMYISMSFVRIVMVILFIAIIPCALSFSPKMFWELGPVENLELLILIIGTLISLYWYVTDTTQEYRNVWLSGSLLMFIAAAREASWGRIFLIEGYNAEGPIIPSMSSLWYGPIIHGIVGLLILLFLYTVIKNYKLINNLLTKTMNNKEWLLYTTMFLVILILSQLVFDKDLIPSLTIIHQGLEETTEVLVYWIAVAILFKTRQISLEHK